MANSTLKGLYAITLCEDRSVEQIIKDCETMLNAGVQWIQYRDKTNDDETKLVIAQQIVNLCKQHNAHCIINDDVELCLKTDAHGVHLGASDESITQAREKLGDDKIIGASCYISLKNAHAAEDAGADYLAFGAMYQSKTKRNSPVGSPATLKMARATFNLPIVAIGGINADNCTPLLEAGADSIAAIYALYQNDNIANNTLQLINTINGYKNNDGRNDQPRHSTHYSRSTSTSGTV